LTAIVKLVGSIATEERLADVTVSDAVFVIAPMAAVIVTVPAPTAVASPLVAPVVLIVATALFDVVQTADAVISWIDASLKVAVTVNCCVVPRAIWAVTGVMLMDNSVAVVTVNADVPVTVPSFAEMTVEPAVSVVATPLYPAALLTVATPVFDELQVTSAVKSSDEPSV
jgi:hypothetical protein